MEIRGTSALASALSASNLEIHVDSGDILSVRHFAVKERMSSLFEVTLTALSDDADIDFDAIVGRPASFRLRSGTAALATERVWTGICKHMQQIAAEEAGLSTYRLVIVPTLWLTTQRRNHRMFQQITELDIVLKLLAEWGIEPELKITGTYKKRKYRVQYAESDFAFMSRMLEDAGVSFYFEQSSADDEAETKLVLSDAPHANGRTRAPIAFRDNPTVAMDREHVTGVHVGQRVRPGRYTVRDHDARLPASYKLLASAEAPGSGIEERLERFHYAPGAFLFGTDQGESTPHADDKGKTRTDEKEGRAIAVRRLEAKRASAKVCTFATNVTDLAPGVLVHILDHPRADLSPDSALLVVEATHEGTHDGKWTHRCEARRTDVAYRPPLATPKPKIAGVESATVVGPPGEEIHTDEFGRVRVHFHWDRESSMDDSSSCWIHVSQPWGGAGYGGTNLPRVGQEVLVDFLGGDPDRPIITGRVYTNLQKVPYKLPENKTQSGWKSSSTQQTGGYNEIMFEDAAGRELVRMQAEKDLNKLVKNDEQVTIGHDRTKLVKNDDSLTIGHDESIRVGNNRSKEVGVDQQETIGSNKSSQVGKNHTESIGQNQTLMVGSDRAKTVGGSQSESVGVNKSIQVGAHHSETIGAAMTLTVGASKTETVGITSTETVGVAKSLTVGGAYAIVAGGMMSTNVLGTSTETVGLTKNVSAGVSYTVTCGASTLTMDKAGNVVVEASNMTITSTGMVNVHASGSVDVEASGAVHVKGGIIHMN